MAGSYRATLPAFHSLTQSRPRESDQTRRAPWSRVGGRTTVALPVPTLMRAMWLPASDAYQTWPFGVVAIPYGPVPPGARKTRIAPVFGLSRP